MPGELWSEAVSLAGVHGVYRISRALRVGYDSLRKRVEQVERGRGELGRGRARSSGFVEVDVARLVGSCEPAHAVVELSGADGAKVVVQLPRGEGVDVLVLAESFWRRRS